MTDQFSDSEPEERTFTQARSSKPIINYKPHVPRTKKIKKTKLKLDPTLISDLEATLPIKKLNKIDGNNMLQTAIEKQIVENNQYTPKIIKFDAKISKVRKIGKHIELIYEQKNRLKGKLNKEYLEFDRKMKFDNKKRMPLSKIIDK